MQSAQVGTVQWGPGSIRTLPEFAVLVHLILPYGIQYRMACMDLHKISLPLFQCATWIRQSSKCRFSIETVFSQWEVTGSVDIFLLGQLGFFPMLANSGSGLDFPSLSFSPPFSLSWAIMTMRIVILFKPQASHLVFSTSHRPLKSRSTGHGFNTEFLKTNKVPLF